MRFYRIYEVHILGPSDLGGPDIRSDSDRDSEAGSNGVSREGSSVEIGIPQSMLRDLITGLSAEVDPRGRRSGRRVVRKSKEKEYKLLTLGKRLLQTVERVFCPEKCTAKTEKINEGKIIFFA